MRILAIGAQCTNAVKFATSADVEIAFLFVCVFASAGKVANFGYLRQGDSKTHC